MQNIGQIVSQPLAWFEALLESSNTMGILLSAITLVLAIRFIIIPLTGGVVAQGQDRVDKQKMRGKYAVSTYHRRDNKTGKVKSYSIRRTK